MEEKKLAEINYDLWILITQVVDVLMLAREYEVKPFGITATQVKVLGMLDYHKKPTMISDLARRLQRKHNGVASLINRMKKDDLVYEVDNPELPRRRIIAISDKGKKIYEETRKITRIHKILSVLTKQQKEQIIKRLLSVRDNAVKELHADTFYLF